MDTKSLALTRQREIYMSGLRGRNSSIPFAYGVLAERAQKVMSKPAWAYIMGAAGAESTMQANRVALDDWKIIPRVLRDISQRSIRTQYLGKNHDTPFFICPIGSLGLVHPEADHAVARVSARLGIPFISSNQSSVSLEDISATLGSGSKMFQLYWSNSDELVQSFIERAERSECDALVVTVDNTLLGWRSKDLESGYLPYLHGHGLAHYTSDPVFKSLVQKSQNASSSGTVNLKVIAAVIEMAYRHPGATLGNLRSGVALKSAQKFVDVFMKPTLNWKDIQTLRSMTNLPIVLKGIQHVEDAKFAMDTGIDAILVSNHGGRQIDGAVGSIDALGDITNAIGDQVDILFDSGIRGGADAFKALAMGAKAVGIGRPYVLALALSGDQGVEDLLLNYLAEFELTMALCGCNNPNEIDRTYLKKNPSNGFTNSLP